MYENRCNAGFGQPGVGMVPMRPCFKIRYRNIAVAMILFAAALLLFPGDASAEDGRIDPGDEVISLYVRDEPLRNALKKISAATGYEFDVDARWQNYPVTASLEAVSLHKGLKSILKNTNSVIVYGPERKIRIIIYDKTRPGEAASGSRDRALRKRGPEPRRPSDSEPALEKGDTGSSEEAPPDRDDESVETPENGAFDGEKAGAEPEKAGKVSGEAESAGADGVPEGERTEKDN